MSAEENTSLLKKYQEGRYYVDEEEKILLITKVSTRENSEIGITYNCVTKAGGCMIDQSRNISLVDDKKIKRITAVQANRTVGKYLINGRNHTYEVMFPLAYPISRRYQYS